MHCLEDQGSQIVDHLGPISRIDIRQTSEYLGFHGCHRGYLRRKEHNCRSVPKQETEIVVLLIEPSLVQYSYFTDITR